MSDKFNDKFRVIFKGQPRFNQWCLQEEMAAFSHQRDVTLRLTAGVNLPYRIML